MTLLCAVSALSVSVIDAQTVTAASCENMVGQTDVQAAVNSTPAGGTVVIPAGSCTWTVPVTFANKKLDFVGAGIGKTIITADTPNTSPLQVTTCSEADFFLAKGITWRLQSAGSSFGIIWIRCSNAGGYPDVTFRLTQMEMYGDPVDGVSNGRRFILASGVYGLVDHSKFYSYTSRGAGNIAMSVDGPVSTSNAYHVPFTFGDKNALYVENNHFYFGVANSGNGAIDNYAGARYVFRYNTVYNNHIGHHGFDTQVRGAATFEVYGNTFIAEPGIGGMTVMHVRSGTGVMWNNTVKNIEPMSSGRGYRGFFAPMYYAAMTQYAMSGNMWWTGRPTLWYPSGTWGALPFPGTTSKTDSFGNYLTGSTQIDGNQKGPDSWDADHTRTVTDVVTIKGSATITSATANFVLDTDRPKNLIGTNIQAGRVVSDGVWTAGSPTITSATANFNAGDVGRHIGMPARALANGATIQSVVNATTVVASSNATATGSGPLLLGASYIVAVTNATTATLNVPATASGTGGTLRIGLQDKGYPALDQPGYGYFPSANAGNWPNESSYSAANYQKLMPMYLWGNAWQTVNAELDVVTTGVPPASAVNLQGSQAYIKRHREWYDDPDTPVGLLSARPESCSVGFAYFATDAGGDWNRTNASANDGALYRCTAPNTWSVHYVPFTYPHPLTAIGRAQAPTNLRIIGL